MSARPDLDTELYVGFPGITHEGRVDSCVCHMVL